MSASRQLFTFLALDTLCAAAPRALSSTGPVWGLATSHRDQGWTMPSENQEIAQARHGSIALGFAPPQNMTALCPAPSHIAQAALVQTGDRSEQTYAG
jgi:hypothetical protein